MNIRVLIVDDHAIVRHGLFHAISHVEGVEVVGQASNGRSAVEMARELRPDVVVMDVGMPDLNGIEATRAVRCESPRTKVIGLSMHTTKRYFSEMFKAGASGYLFKGCEFEELITAIHRVASGQSYVSPEISDGIIQGYAEVVAGEEGNAFTVLTGRERQVLQLMAEGNSTKQVGQCLSISPKTVEAHRLRIMNKLNIDNVALLTKYAIREGLTCADI